MKYGIVIFPSKEIQDFVNGYRKRYDLHYALIQPHLTVKSAFEADSEMIQKGINYLEKVTSDSSPFEVSLKRFSSFHPTNNVIYMEVANPEPIEQLHQQIHNDVLAVEEPYSFIPHITIGQKMTDDELQDVYSSLKMKRFDYQFKVDRIHLVYQTEDRVWKEQQSFILKG